MGFRSPQPDLDIPDVDFGSVVPAQGRRQPDKIALIDAASDRSVKFAERRARTRRATAVNWQGVPKIDWFDNTDDQPRWEPRMRRERLPRDVRERRARLDQIIAMASSPPLVPDVPTRRPLHLIWGAPMRRPASDAGGQTSQE